MSDTPPDLTPEQVSPEPSPKKRIVRRAKSAAEAPAESHAAAEVSGTEQGSSPAPRKRTARKKVPELAGEGMESTDAPQKKSARKSSAEIPAAEGTEEAPAKPRRGRPRKKPVEEVPETAGSPDVPVTEAPVKPVRRRSAKTIALKTMPQRAPKQTLPFPWRLPNRPPVLRILLRNSPKEAGRR